MAQFIWMPGSGNLQDPAHWMQPPAPPPPPPDPFIFPPLPPPPFPPPRAPGPADDTQFSAGSGVQVLTGFLAVHTVTIVGPPFGSVYALSGSMSTSSFFNFQGGSLTLNSSGSGRAHEGRGLGHGLHGRDRDG